MSNYTVAADEVAAYGKVLVANVVDTVTLTRTGDTLSVRVTNDTGTAEIYFTTNGTAPVVGDAKCYRVAAAAGAYTDVSMPGQYNDTDPLPVVKIKSVGTPTYSVEVAG